jgi:hypothetical protein
MISLALCFFFYNHLHAEHLIRLKGKIIGNQQNLQILHDNIFTPIQVKNGIFEINLKGKDLPINISLASIEGRKVHYLSPKIWINKNEANLTFLTDEKSYKMDHPYPLQEISEKIEMAKTSNQLQLIKKNSNTIPAMFFLNENKDQYSTDEISSIYDKISIDNQKNRWVQKVKAYIDAKQLKAPKKGKKFNSFSLKNIDGKLFEISNNSAKYQLICFTSYGCYFSKASIPTLQKLNDKYKSKIDFITIWKNNDDSMWHDKKCNINWINLWDKNEFAYTYFDIKFFPYFYLVNEKGEIVDTIKDYMKLEKTLRKHMKF